MSEKRMPFVAPMVQAFLAKRKTQTRRVWPIQPGPGNDSYVKFDPKTGIASWPGESEFDSYTVKSRYLVGDLVWIGESTWEAPQGFIAYRASVPERPAPDWKLRTGRFMFKKDARMWREVTSVRAQRVWSISPEDAIAEGIEPMGDGYYANYLLDKRGDNLGTRLHPVESYRTLWNSLHGKDHPWIENPWLFVYGLKDAVKPE